MRNRDESFARGLGGLLDAMESVSSAFTRPGARNAWVVFAGWVLTTGVHAVTQALVVTDVARRIHHERFHRFFSRGSWDPDALGRLLFERIVSRLCPDGRLLIALDDTLAAKKGTEVFGLGNHLDAVHSSKHCRVFSFGHVWVVLAVVVRVPFSSRSWALPVLLRLYRNRSDCERAGHRFWKKTELGRQMVEMLLSWAGDRSIDVVADSAYCNDTLMRGLSKQVTVCGAIRPDAVLTAAPVAGPKRPGRRPTRGLTLPKPEQIYSDRAYPWHNASLTLYGRQTVVSYKVLRAQWYRGAGTRLGLVIVVHVERGRIPMRVFFCSDCQRDPLDVLTAYAGRWSIEVCFRDLKQHLGFADSSARKQAAVERVAPFVAYCYSLLVLWFSDGVCTSALAIPPIRPWYAHRKHASFADVLRAAQRVLDRTDVLDPARGYNNLRQLARPLQSSLAPSRRRAA